MLGEPKQKLLFFIQEYITHPKSYPKVRFLLMSGGSLLLTTVGVFLFLTWHNNVPKLPYFLSCLNFSENTSTDLENEENRPRSKRVKRGHPPGILNFGNSCFANCVLQALSSLENFNQWVIQISSELDHQYCTVVPSLCKLVQALSNRSFLWCDSCTTADLIDSLQAHGWVIPGDQQDAHEFYQVLISTIDDELVDHINRFNFPALCSKLTMTGEKELNTLEVPPVLKSSPMRGLLASRLTCLTCNFQFPLKFEHFNGLSLRIPHFAGGSVSLESCLRDFIKSEKVDDVSCPGCKGSRSSFCKQLYLAKVPRCLCLQIQRTYFQNTGKSYKNPTYIKFPEILDIHPFSYTNALCQKGRLLTTRKTRPTVFPLLRGGNFEVRSVDNCIANKEERFRSSYSLMALVVHHGEVSDGHFVTYRRNIKRTKSDWIYISDTLVKKASLSDALSSVAYLLFYEKVSRSR